MFLKIKEDALKYKSFGLIWDLVSTINDEDYKRKVTKILINKSEFFELAKTRKLSWDDVALEYIKNDMNNVMIYLYSFLETSGFPLINNLITEFKCDDIFTYDMVLTIASCKSRELLLDVLSKTDLSVEEQRSILLKNKTSCVQPVRGGWS